MPTLRFNSDTFKYASKNDNIISIKDETFSYCENLTSITLPNSIITIEKGAFSGCKSLTNIALPNNLETIGALSFYYCESITSITIPSNITNIERGAFYNCNNLMHIYVKRDTPIEFDSLIVDLFDDWCFDDYTCEKAILYVPKGSLTAYQTAIGWKKFKNIHEFQVD